MVAIMFAMAASTGRVRSRWTRVDRLIASLSVLSHYRRLLALQGLNAPLALT